MRKPSNKRKYFLMVTLIIGVLLIMTACSNNNEKSPEKVSNQTEAVTTDEKEITLETDITTAYGSLPYPSTTQGNITVEYKSFNSGEQVLFYGTVNMYKLHLYTISFGIPEGYPMGGIQTDDDIVGIYVFVPEISEDICLNEYQLQSAYALKESINDIVPAIEQFDGFIPQNAITNSENQSGIASEINISIPYGELSFQSAWADWWRTEEKEENGVYTLYFLTEIQGEDQILLAVCFGAESNNIIGWIGKDGTMIPVSFFVPDFEIQSSWSTDDKARIQTMMEDINSIIDVVRALPGFEG